VVDRMLEWMETHREAMHAGHPVDAPAARQN
jgi:hypothetical protein